MNGERCEFITEKGYLVIDRTWKKGDRISLDLDFNERIIKANEQVADKAGLLAVQYGPIVYCAEEIDNTEDVLLASLQNDSDFEVRFAEELLGGVNTLEGEGLKLIPYYAWANREMGKMNVWFRAAD